EGDHLNTHFRAFQAPMGMALDGDRLAIGTTYQVWEYANVPAVAARLDPPGRHDACFLPRSCHVTGNIQIHEMAYGASQATRERKRPEGSTTPVAPAPGSPELWAVNTRFSCLCTLDRSASFTPRWRPPFVRALEPSDRCHLNGLGMVAGRPKYVTALGETDEPTGWRAGKAEGGILMDWGTGGGDWRRAADAPLAALVGRAALGVRGGGGNARVRRAGDRPVRADRRGARVHTRTRLRRQPGVRRPVAGARERRLQRHPDHR